MRKCKYCNEDITGYASGSTFCWLCAWGGYKTRNKNNVKMSIGTDNKVVYCNVCNEYPSLNNKKGNPCYKCYIKQNNKVGYTDE